MKVRKGDRVKIISGNDRGTQGKVLAVFPKTGRIVVEGVNMRKKHVRSRTAQGKGEVVRIPVPLVASRAMLLCPACGKPTRVGYGAGTQGRSRVCKKCGAQI